MVSAMDEALAYVRRVAAAYDPCLRLAATEAGDIPAAAGGGVLVCAPHPDDESLCGALALRLAREEGCPVTALAVTLGSDAARKEARLREFADACGALGWGWQPARQPLAFDGVNPAQRDRDLAAWRGKVAAVVGILDELRPDLVLLPHLDDAHPTHIGTHQLCMEALVRHATDCGREILVAETEFWHPLGDANLLVGVGEEDVARLVYAVSRHRGEVARHPYHAQLPFRMVDTVRRGAEMLAGFGGGVPPFRFGELYRLARFENGRLRPATRGVVFGPEARLSLAALRSAC